MEQTAKIIGANIAAFRKAKGLTQEQLAAKLGVSPPAVSKWETGSSCPDIALLCPLARALDTHVDALLQFEETLSEQQISEEMNEILDRAIAQDLAGAERRLQELLRQYPGCTALQYNAVTAYGAFQTFAPDQDDATQARWRQCKRLLLEEVRATGKALYWQGATVQLAGLAIAEGKLEEGERLLKELPESVSDPTSVWTMYYLKKGETEEALKRTQKQLYRLVMQVQGCLCLLMDPRLLSGPERLYKVGCAYRAIAQAFGLMDASDGPLMEAYLEMGDVEKAASCFVRYVDAILGPAVLPDEDLFEPGLQYEHREGTQATTPVLRRMLVQSMVRDERYRTLRSNPDFVAALEKLKASI